MSKDMNVSVNGESQVPPGFRFHPTEEELLHYYLRKKVASQKIDLDVILDVDLNKLEPWDIQEKCRLGSSPQNDWYLFSHKDKKYPSGTRTNRATTAGFWKATGRDKVIYSNSRRIGMRKTLVFYTGRAPHGQRSDWIMHEYRLDDSSHDAASSASTSEDGWVVCRVFKKKKHHKTLDSPQTLANNNTGGVLDQILTYMGQDETKNSNSNYAKMQHEGQMNDSLCNALQATQFLHLPALLETQSTTEISSHIGSPLTQHHYTCFSTDQSFENMLSETELPASCYGTSYLNNFLHLPLDDDHGFGLINLCSSIRPNDHHNSQVHGNNNGFWTNKHSSSLSPSDPLWHWSE